MFWKIYEMTPERERGGRLREWYLSEFYPDTLNAPFDLRMGFQAPETFPGDDVVYRRLIAFREAERDAAITHAALADWFHSHGDPKQADFLIQQTPRLEKARRDPFFLAVNVKVLMDLGRFREAEELVSRWPAPRAGFWYWRWRGIVLEEVLKQDEAAFAHYDQALAASPGKIDWPLLNRKSQCLKRLGRNDEAAGVRSHAREVEERMAPENHKHLREVLADLSRPARLQEIVEFYRTLRRSREVKAWEEYIAFFKSSSAGVRNNRDVPPRFLTP